MMCDARDSERQGRGRQESSMREDALESDPGNLTCSGNTNLQALGIELQT